MLAQKSRRTFLKKLGVAAVVPALPALSPSVKDSFTPRLSGSIGTFEVIGRIALKKPSALAKSPFGIGCETLDRELWEPEEVYPWMTDLPVKWARLQTGWARVEREKGKYEWDWLDKAVDGLLERGIQPFFNVSYGNPNYTEGGARYHPLANEASVAAWKRFVEAMTVRYRDRISHFEIWNEPNLSGFWQPDDPNPRLYVHLVAETAPIIRRQAPEAVIIGGVVSRLPADYIREMFEAGLADFIDIFSFHPYGTVPEYYVPSVRVLRRLIDRYNPDIPIWQGENGFPSDPESTGFSGAPPWTENIQAKIMLRRLLTDLSVGIEMSLWFLIVDLHDYPKGSGKVNYKGILRVKPEIKPKVAYHVLQNLGSVIFGEVEQRLAVTYAADGSHALDETFRDAVYQGVWPEMKQVYSTSLNTGNGPVVAYWSTLPAQDEKPEGFVHLLYQDWEGKGFRDPVLVNPFSGDISALPEVTREPGVARTEAQIFERLPLVDYPLLIMERDRVLAG